MSYTDETRIHVATLALLQQTAAGNVNLGVPETFPLEIAPRIFWLGSCLRKGEGADDIHTGVSAYLILGTEHALLVDTGHIHGWPVLSEQLDYCLGDRSLDFVMPTHPEIPHGGNLAEVLTKYPSCLAIGDMRDYHLYFPDVVDRFCDVPVGHIVDLGGGYRYHVLDAAIKDLPNTRWGYEEKNQVMFVADGFSYLHHPEWGEEGVDAHVPGECGKIASVGGAFPTLDDIAYYCSVAFYWSRFRPDATQVFERLEALMQRYPPRVVAPAHGNVVTDLGRVVPLVREAHVEAFRH